MKQMIEELRSKIGELLSRRGEPRTGGQGRLRAAFGGARALWLVLVVLVVCFVGLIKFAFYSPADGREVGLDRVYGAAQARLVKSARLLDEEARVVGEMCREPDVAPAPRTAPRPRRPGSAPPSPAQGRAPACPRTFEFVASYPESDVATQQLIDALRRGGAGMTVDQQSAKAVAKLVATFVLPLLMLATIFGIIFLTRSGGGPLGEIAGFGTIGSKGKRGGGGGEVTFADVAGAEEAVAELREVVDYLGAPERFAALGAAVPKGVLLFGPPGCGKTLLARAVAGESGVPFFSVSGTEFVESLVGIGAARVRDLFRQVRQAAPAIVFIDEIDAVGRRRSGEGTSGGEREQTLNQLLVELDGFEVTSGIVLMGATNRPDMLDPALMRPGRFDRHVTLDPPDLSGREAILGLHAQGRPVAPDADFELLARRTAGFTGADLANVINEGALLAIREGGGQIGSEHLTEAIQRVLHGPRRKGRLITPEERRRLAFHEAGHAVVAAALGHADTLHRVTIVARGRALGQSTLSSDGDRVLLTKDELSDELAVAMAGVAAEELCFGGSSTTAEHDLGKATALAREMVGRYGMSAGLGRVRILSAGTDGYLGDGGGVDYVSGQTLQNFDTEVKRLLSEAEAEASQLLHTHNATLREVADALLEQETLEGQTLAQLLAQAAPPEQPTKPIPPA